MRRIQIVRMIVIAVALGWGASAAALEPESKRLGRAKDFIADEQWPRAIEELRAAVGDPAETRRDEALYWLAHSLYQSGDPAAAVETISRLEREFPRSMWVKPARSMRIEIAARLDRYDVLWYTALPPQPAPAKAAPQPDKPAAPVGPRKGPGPAKAAPPAYVDRVEIPPPPPKVWLDPESLNPDVDLQILALGALLKNEGDKVIPILKQIAVETSKPDQAGRAVFMLAQSNLPEARAIVMTLAKTGPEPVRVFAVREWGRFGGPEVSKELMQEYPTAVTPVRMQIVKSLGERSEKGALAKIVASERETEIRFKAISCLAQAGGAAQLAAMYKTLGAHGKRSAIVSLSTVRADGELVRIARIETDPQLRALVVDRLRLLGTPTAKEYLQKVSEKR